MHQTTIRFGSDLWESLAEAAAAEGVSVAQYVRESAVERLVRAGAADEDPPIAATDRRRDARAPRRPATSTVGEGLPVGPSALSGPRTALVARWADGQRAVARNAESSAAVWAQSRLARARSRELRADSRALAGTRRDARAAAGRSSADPEVPDPAGAVPRAGRARA